MSSTVSLSQEEWTTLYNLSSSSQSDYEALLPQVTEKVFFALVELILNATLFSSNFNKKFLQGLIARLMRSRSDFVTTLQVNREAIQSILSYIFLKSITAEIIIATCGHGIDDAGSPL